MTGVVSIRAALETALAAMSPALATIYENASAEPPEAGTAYQRAFVLFARPENRENTAAHLQSGFMQVDLLYPTDKGSADAAARAELIRSTFYRGASFTSGGVNVSIDGTPEVRPGQVEDGRWRLTVRVPFFAQVPAP